MFCLCRYQEPMRMPEMATDTYQPGVHQSAVRDLGITTNNKGRFSYPDTTKIYPGGYVPVDTDTDTRHVVTTANRKHSSPAYFMHDGYDVCPRAGVVRVTSSLPPHGGDPDEADIPQTYMGLALVVTLCFNCPIGLLALLIAYCSRKSWLSGKKGSASLQARISLVVSMLGILATIAIVIGVVWYAVRQKEKDDG